MSYKDDSTNISGVWTTFMRWSLENKSLDNNRAPPWSKILLLKREMKLNPDIPFKLKFNFIGTGICDESPFDAASILFKNTSRSLKRKGQNSFKLARANLRLTEMYV